MHLFALEGIAEVIPGDDVAEILIESLTTHHDPLEEGDVIVLAQKIVSKAEGRYAFIDEVEASEHAVELGAECDKDPRLVQLILDESEDVLRVRPGVIIVQHKRGYVHANAGIDRSNLPETERERVLLLPVDSDASAEQLRQRLSSHFGVNLGVIINDSAGRAWRVGTQGFAIGTAGFNPLIDMVGKSDRNGRAMEVTEVAVADELAAAASYLMGQANEGKPAVVIRGAKPTLGDYPSSVLIRDKKMDMFR
ncbi:Coenzyme F420:L-glutamate ligase [BD1-7 clade bacterium]|uniref:Coenzyme F420:L-glutamate ligase n=1 Tax=BD1-7 clade bacterium TaxID=2029982 RepID=A0A5S9QI96_9GAMM|nr:Coenzyme F420:L-glutamate ligase [BD1-7 clade bacterium]